ncbi:MAG: NlpC/P60 family protein [Bacteroidales bacterium]
MTNYPGWIDNDHLSEYVVEDEVDSLIIGSDTPVTLSDGSMLIMPAGSEIYNADLNSGQFRIGNIEMKATGRIEVAPLGKSFVTDCIAVPGSSISLGWSDLHGIDCSGLVQTVFKIHEELVYPDSFNQAEKGVSVEPLSDAIPGDLLFFDNPQGKIIMSECYMTTG